MELAALHFSRSASRPASDLPLEQLAGNAGLTEGQKIAEGARQFEALLLRQILQESQKTVFQSKFTDNSTAAGIYRDLVTQHLAESISKSGSVGLAQSLEGQLTRQSAPASLARQDSGPAVLANLPLGGRTARPPLRDALSATANVSPQTTPASNCKLPALGVAIAPAHLP